MSNQLKDSNSLYLRQHADNPVHWQPWGDTALVQAQAENKPLLVSIGYSACHWCHVMAHESFEDDYIAGIMNKHFVCIKVDREERPDVDQIYMEAVQMLQHQGGWPLNVFCLPDGRPFFGGTYFPPEDRGQGMIPWPQLLMRIVDFYERSQDELIENADSIQKNIMASNQQSGSEWNSEVLVKAAQGICGNHDDQYGGFGGAPKFPPAMTLNFLNSVRHLPEIASTDPELPARIDAVCATTLKAMAHGGLFDQFGGGFARYSVDAHWLIPHFEKMLYDNALLVEAYTRASLDNENPLYPAVVHETIAWLEREMSAPDGGFYAALDADSEGEEGRFYVWDPEELDTVLGPTQSREVRTAYNITSEGNFENGKSNPALVEADYATRKKLTAARLALRKHRDANRVAPGRDPKICLAWNALMVRALANAGFYLNEPGWLERARLAADFIWDKMRLESSSSTIQLHSVYYEKAGSSVPAFLHDYALAAEAFLAVAAKIDWLQPGVSHRYRERAQACLNAALDQFVDPQNPGFFFTAAGVETPVARRKEWFDNAQPSGNSSLLHALSGMYCLTGDARYGDALHASRPIYADYAKRVASGVAHGLEALSNDTLGILNIKAGKEADLEALRATLIKLPWRRCYIQISNDADIPADHFQLCQGSSCGLSNANPQEILSSFHAS
jgi:uncharacterized protein YyaL (SSP411 family)